MKSEAVEMSRISTKAERTQKMWIRDVCVMVILPTKQARNDQQVLFIHHVLCFSHARTLKRLI